MHSRMSEPFFATCVRKLHEIRGQRHFRMHTITHRCIRARRYAVVGVLKDVGL